MDAKVVFVGTRIGYFSIRTREGMVVARNGDSIRLDPEGYIYVDRGP